MQPPEIIKRWRVGNSPNATQVVLYNNGRVQVWNDNRAWSDNPIRYDTGQIAYENPAMVGTTARQLVARAYRHWDRLPKSYTVHLSFSDNPFAATNKSFDELHPAQVRFDCIHNELTRAGWVYDPGSDNYRKGAAIAWLTLTIRAAL